MARHCEYSQQIRHLKMSIDEIVSTINKHKTIKEWAYIIHDKDTSKDGTPVEPHIHLYLNFGRSGATFDTVAKWFKDEPQYVDKVHGRKSDILMYLTHLNAPEKYQYEKTDVISNFDIEKAIKEDKTTEYILETIDATVFDFAQEKITYAQAHQCLQDMKIMCKSMELLDYWIKAVDRIQKLWKQQCTLSTKGKRDMQIIFIHGKSGSGKSTYAEMYADMLCKVKGYRDYSRSSAINDIMQDYMGEDIFILDDYRDVDEATGTTQNLTDVLKMLDPHFASSSRSRYTNKTFTGKLIIITSTKDPLLWFEKTKEQRWQFFRRISKLIEIDEKNVTEYQEMNNESGVPFLCGFKHTGSYIEKAEQKKQFPNPVAEYVRITGKPTVEDDDLSADITEYLSALKREKESA